MHGVSYQRLTTDVTEAELTLHIVKKMVLHNEDEMFVDGLKCINFMVQLN